MVRSARIATAPKQSSLNRRPGYRYGNAAAHRGMHSSLKASRLLNAPPTDPSKWVRFSRIPSILRQLDQKKEIKIKPNPYPKNQKTSAMNSTVHFPLVVTRLPKAIGAQKPIKPKHQDFKRKRF
jgi:hypothetical protein